ncbi:uncharacterized protein ASPGLDRAFT_1076543 [Aspergillus glaucus CBS 516.65]|uniref:Major facilitator superfamily (MFS) profile domain-containing protein n=1 Tax=Aspergillus glaucus CBS 516.65 TaxID=1160497 RepID=A0A1L9V511_ASPGL|nr:hypothetical protein ASPGLDRAFT_1076543 [Aspergillus glaucus CBS 516.65]OJJ79033.1 hypothetical protein ASPGLDRAFT_1076543 [Aspergillus glaucus CBS 516.65]
MAIDETTPILQNRTEYKSRGLGKLAIATALFGVFLANIDDSFVTAIYGEIASQFQHLQDGSWLLAGYNLGYCAALPVHGRLGDIYGRKTPLLAAYAVFGFGLAVSGSAFSLWQVIIGRVITGIGSSGMVGLISIVITDTSTLEQVAVLRSYVTVVAIAGYSLGAPLGGILADLVGWRMSFAGQVPIVLICLLIVTREIPSPPPPQDEETTVQGETSNSNDDANGEPSSKPTTKPGIQNFDIPGLITFLTTIITFLFLNLASQKLPITHPLVLTIAAISIISATLFFLIETIWSPSPLIPLTQIWRNGVAPFCLGQVSLFIALVGLVAQIPSFFIRTQSTTNTQAAAHLIPLTIGCAVGGLLSGQIINRTHRYKPLSLFSVSLNTLSHLLIFVTWRHGASTTSSLVVFITGLAHGLVISTQFIGMSARVEKSMVASSVSAYYLCQELGTIGGACLGGAVEGGVFRQLLQKNGLGSEVVKGVLNDTRFAARLSMEVQRVVADCYLYAFRFIPVLSTCSCAVALIFIVSQKEKKLR